MSKYKKIFSLMTSLCLISTFIFINPVQADALSLGGAISKLTNKLTSSKKNTSSKSNSTNETQVLETDSKASELSYFPVTMYRYGTSNSNGTSYDSSAFNQATKNLETNNLQGIYFNTGSSTTWISGTSITNKYWNRWSANANSNSSNLRVSAITGLVKNELDSSTGKIQFNYPEAGIFDPDNNTAKSTYTNVKMPFRYDSSTGYYEFDSSKENVYFANGKGASNTTLNYNGNGFSVSGFGKGFYPFNTGNSGTGNYHFGMNMSVNFFMTEDGKINGTDDIKFEFSGDDDVWVFIDGKLVLDIGGIHDATSGSINFATGEVINPRTLSGINSGKTQGTQSSASTKTNLYEILGVGSLDKFDKTKAHTLQVFYLERGRAASNCKIKFNLPQQNTLEVSKKFDDTISDLTQEEIAAVKSEVFDFTITKDGSALANATYQLYEGNTEIDADKQLATDANGKFTLKAGQTVRFYNPSQGKYVVTENNDDYEKNWTVGQVGGNTTTGSNNSSPELNINTSNQGYTYTFTCENVLQPVLNDDAVVLDFGKPIDINVTNNDFLRGGTLDSVSMLDDITNYGTISKKDNNNVTYTLNKFMNGIDRATYSVKYNDDKNSKTGNITMIPATSVYYEDDFTNSNGIDGIQYSSNWKVTGTSSNGSQDDGTIGKDYPYGYDSSYSENTTDSNGSSHYIEATTNSETATFTFKGTGCEIYSRTSNKTGRVRAQVYKGTELISANRLTNSVIDTLYKEEGKELYNIPIFNITDLEYGEYTVVLTAVKGTNAIPRNIFYLDGVRIYNPLDETQSEEANNAYQTDNEANAKVVELRDKLIVDGVGSSDESINGVVFIDTNGGETTSDTTKYTNEGPKNEIYLKQGQKITFKLNELPEGAKVQIGAKATEGKELNLDINSSKLSLKSTVDMYYDITSSINSDGSITITNNSEGMLSLTKLKVTSISNEYEIFNSFKLEDYSTIVSN
ncbi:fibro-slime domain-containing protein [Romboutsia sp. Marseille-P6047]|uniref:fibro-slime domain-containing protein n=1 Tax=Romboutsia sp. Marseille-P6047 TaxID=2161817 RepID=UPI000F0574FB|nr:fibro-slime domain-containing protein [Romboutsia sp. Marseille-P6047]